MKIIACQLLPILSLCLWGIFGALAAAEEQAATTPDQEQNEPPGPEAFENVLLPTAWEFTQFVLQGDWEQAQKWYLLPPVNDSEPDPLAAEVQQVFADRQKHHGGQNGGFQIFEAQSVQVLGFQGGWVVPVLFTGETGLSISYDLWVNTRDGWRVLPMRVIGRENLLVSLPPGLTTRELIPEEEVERLGETLDKLGEEGKDLGRRLLESLERLREN